MEQDAAGTCLKIVLIEDSHRLLELLAGMLREIDGVTIVGAAADEAAAIRMLEEIPADLVIIDLELRAGSGMGVLRTLAREPERFHRPRAVVFSNHDHLHLRERCRKLGAERFFNKVRQLDELIDFVSAAGCGH